MPCQDTIDVSDIATLVSAYIAKSLNGAALQFSGLRSIAVNSAQMAGARLLSPVVRAVYVVVLATYLGPEVYGVLAYSQSWYLAFLPVAVLGLGAILMREIGRNRARASEVLAQAFALRIVATLLSAAFCVGIGWAVEADPLARRLLTIFGIGLAGRALAILAEHVFVAYESSGYLLRQEALFRPLEVVLGLAALALGGGAVAVALVHAGLWWAQAGRGLYLVQTRFLAVRPSWSWGPLGRLLVQAFPVALTGVFTTWLLQGPLVLYRHVAETTAELGQMAIVIQGLMILVVVPLSAGAAALPVLSRAVARRDGKDLRFVEGLCRLALVLGAAGALTGMAAGPWLVETVFGSDFERAGDLIGPALWLAIPIAMGSAAQAGLFARANYVSTTLCAAAGALVLTGSVVPLVSEIGPVGLIVAAAAGQTVWALGSLAVLTREGGGDILRALARPLGAVALSIAVYAALASIHPWLSLSASLLALLAGSLALGVVSPEERRILLNIVEKTLRGRPPHGGDRPNPDR